MMKLDEDRGQHVHQDFPLHDESERTLHCDMVVTRRYFHVHRLQTLWVGECRAEFSISRNRTSCFHALRNLSELQLMVVVNWSLVKVDENQSFRRARDHHYLWEHRLRRCAADRRMRPQR